MIFPYTRNKKFGSLFTLFKILIEKNENIEAVKIDEQLINLQKEQVLKEAYKIKEFVLNVATTKSAINSVDFDSFDSLLNKGKTWLAKEELSQFSYFKKITNEELERIFLK